MTEDTEHNLPADAAARDTDDQAVDVNSQDALDTEDAAERDPFAARDDERDIVIRALDCKRHYGTGDAVTKALDGITLNIYRGEFLAIMGPSGSGKSTLFNVIGGLDAPTDGRVYIDEIDIAQLDSYELAWMRCRKVGYIFQSYNILPVLTALENVTLPMLFAGLSATDAWDKGAEILKRVGLGERLFHRPYELSGGQQQRVAIARAMANDPVIILADEPTANLDARTGEEIIDLLCQLKAEDNVTIISATHDMKMLSVSERILWIRDGRVHRLENREALDIRVGRVGDESV